MRQLNLLGATALLCLGLSGTAPAFAANGDYLNPALRERVEILKAEVAASATTVGNLAERSQALWDWANAYALEGGYLPVDLTAAIRPNVTSRDSAAAAVDAYVGELALLDEDRNALGTLTADTGPFEARTWATLQQTWTVGSRPLAPGGGIVVTRHFMGNYGAYQTTDPAGDNYVSIASSDTSVRFEATLLPVSGMHGGFRAAENSLMFQLMEGTLDAGDTVTVTYGNRADGSRGLQMPTFSSDRMPFPLYLVFEPEGHTFSLPIQPIRVTGTQLHGVHGFAPSVVRPGEPFELSIRAQDRFFNRAQPPIPAWQVFANDRLIAEVPAGDAAIRLVENVRLEEPGSYWLSIRSADGTIRGVTNPILVSADARRVFWGDTHGHSGFAEGIGTPDRFMIWARDDARLDFVSHSEHDVWTDDHEWLVLRDAVERYSVPGRFTAYLGYEWSTRRLFGGHHNVLFRTSEGRERVPTQFFPTLSGLYAGLRARHRSEDVLIIPHAHQAGDYRQSDPELQSLVEIMSQHGNFEWFGRMYLSQGHQVGFTAASDNHLSQPGYTAPLGGALAQRGGLGAVLADDSSRDSLFDAMKALSAYATSGDRIILDVSLNGSPMGQRVPFAEERTLTGRVVGSAPIESITVVKNDVAVWHRDLLTVEDGAFAEEETFYLSFSSESIPLHRGDNPRGWRPWTGALVVDGATLTDAEPADLVNSDVHNLSRSGNRMTFATRTRGNDASIRLTLRDIGPDARIAITLQPGQEFGTSPPAERAPAALAGADIELPLAMLARGRLSRSLPLEIYEDTVTLRRSIATGERDVRFEFQDTGSVQGDYYYVRVNQVNDAMAWSSPIWVGGQPPR